MGSALPQDPPIPDAAFINQVSGHAGQSGNKGPAHFIGYFCGFGVKVPFTYYFWHKLYLVFAVIYGGGFEVCFKPMGNFS